MLSTLAAVAVAALPAVWPVGSVVSVVDLTDPAYVPIVQAETSAWSALLPSGTALVYTRGVPTDCASVSLPPPPGTIAVCSTRSNLDGEAWGEGFFWTDADGAIDAGAAEIEQSVHGDKARHFMVCHELGHALGLPHIRSKRSCMNPRHVTRRFPGSRDAGWLRHAYGGT